MDVLLGLFWVLVFLVRDDADFDVDDNDGDEVEEDWDWDDGVSEFFDELERMGVFSSENFVKKCGRLVEGSFCFEFLRFARYGGGRSGGRSGGI